MNASAEDRFREARWHLRWAAFATALLINFACWAYGSAIDPEARAFAILPAIIAVLCLIAVISEIRAALLCRRHAHLLK